jgi:hypothetical protein
MVYKKLLLKYIRREFMDVDNIEYKDELVVMLKEPRGKKEARIKIYMKESIKVLKALIELSKENGWLNDFIPRLMIYFNKSKRIRKPDTKELTIETISSQIYKEHSYCDNTPYISLTEKIFSTWNMEGESYIYYLPRKVLEDLYGEKFNENYYISYVYYKTKEELEKGNGYNRYIDIQYNENKSEEVRLVKRLKLNRNNNRSEINNEVLK